MTGCCVVGCKNHSRKGYRMLGFPRDPNRRKLWHNKMGSTYSRNDWAPTNYSALCEAHFEITQFELHRADGRRKLRPDAVPTLFGSSVRKIPVPSVPDRKSSKTKKVRELKEESGSKESEKPRKKRGRKPKLPKMELPAVTRVTRQSANNSNRENEPTQANRKYVEHDSEDSCSQHDRGDQVAGRQEEEEEETASPPVFGDIFEKIVEAIKKDDDEKGAEGAFQIRMIDLSNNATNNNGEDPLALCTVVCSDERDDAIDRLCADSHVPEVYTLVCEDSNDATGGNPTQDFSSNSDDDDDDHDAAIIDLRGGNITTDDEDASEETSAADAQKRDRSLDEQKTREAVLKRKLSLSHKKLRLERETKEQVELENRILRKRVRRLSKILEDYEAEARQKTKREERKND